MIEPLPLYVVYDHPKDFPPGFVVRRWLNDTPTEEALLFKTLLEARDFASDKGGRACLARFDEDDPVIVEVWM